MFKKTKLLSVLFVSILILLTGCGGSLLAFKKGDKYKESDGYTFIEITEDNEWKMHGKRDRANEYALYKVEETEYKGGKYAVVSLSLKEQFGKSDPLHLISGAEKYLVAPTDNGMSIGRVDHNMNNHWEKFQKNFKEAEDKEAFLKEVAEKLNRKYEKTN
ncbi:hypothetical protein FC699_15170 [Bacillus wiedmannii]|uniref:Uncharacterized protein n=1 Tax=Bacillus wiedmannii TaxID=1890302 RepID=A0A4U3AZ68_9BACI|nr:hypothetical protein FC699_15170 [Bacillus wiedmannii]